MFPFIRTENSNFSRFTMYCMHSSIETTQKCLSYLKCQKIHTKMTIQLPLNRMSQQVLNRNPVKCHPQFSPSKFLSIFPQAIKPATKTSTGTNLLSTFKTKFKYALEFHYPFALSPRAQITTLICSIYSIYV